MSRVRADKLVDRNATGAPSLTYGVEVPVGYGITGAGGINVSGMVTASAGLDGNATGLTGTPNITVGNISASGGDLTIRNITGVAATFTGVLTYEDVTNVDSVGIVTARGGLEVGAAGVGGTISSGGNVIFAGITTLGSDVSIADKIIHAGDTNTAIRFPSADNISFEAGGVERLRIDNVTGNQVIARDTTASILRVENSTAAASQVAMIDLAPANSLSGVQLKGTSEEDYSTGANRTAFFTVDVRKDGTFSERLRITSAGNIGINTVTPQQMLDVRGSAVIGIDQRSGNPGTTVGILTVRGHHVNSDSDYAQLYLSNSLSSGTASASIRAGRSGDNYGTTLSFYNNPTGGVAETERMRITAGGVVKVAGITSTASLTVGPGIIQEKFYNQGSALTGTYNHDLDADGMVLYAYANASASFILNVRGDASTTLNSLMHIGQTSVFTAYTGSNNTSYYMTDFKIDGASQTEKWNGGTAPSAGTGSGVDVYTFNILKTADATFSVFATFSNFA